MSGEITIVFDEILQVADGMDGRLDDLLSKYCFDVVEEATTRMSESSHPSSPGSAPAIVTGNLANSTEVSKVDEHAWQIAWHAAYAAYLEFGTSKMAARPYALPAALAKAPELEEGLATLIPGA